MGLAAFSKELVDSKVNKVAAAMRLLSGHPGPWTAYMAAGGQQGLPNQGHADYAPLAAADVEQREQYEAEVMAGARGGANESLCMPLVAHEQGGPGP